MQGWRQQRWYSQWESSAWQGLRPQHPRRAPLPPCATSPEQREIPVNCSAGSHPNQGLAGEHQHGAQPRPGRPAAGQAPDAKNGKYFGEQKVLNAGKTTSILVSDVLAGTQFHVCAASPSGSPGGPYDAGMSY